jgi:hypothetical protein
VLLSASLSPVTFLYYILWFCILVGVGLRQARQALELEELGLTHFNDTKEFPVPGSDTVFTNYPLGVTLVCKFDSDNADLPADSVLYSFSYPDELESGFGPLLTGVFLLSLAILLRDVVRLGVARRRPLICQLPQEAPLDPTHVLGCY